MQENDYRQWFYKADQDESSMIALLSIKQGNPNTVCFLAQQMAEKYLKGLLIFNKENLRKIHDLIGLESMLLKKVPDIEKLHKDLTFLNGFYVGTRYPGDFPDFDWKMAEQAFAKAEKIKKFVLERVEKN